MTIAKTDTPAYTDLAGLSDLRRGAAAQDPAAIRKVAEQFESLFTRMMLKSMRDAVGPDPMFGSDQGQMYQSMADDQLSVQLSKGRGLGLADMLIHQLQKLGVKGAGAAVKGASAAAGAAATYEATRRASSPPVTSATPEAVQTNFIRDLWPQAQQAGRQLGVDPGNLIAQAALETHWGQSPPRDPAGHSSNNLFGIKASGDWTGSTVTADTREYAGGAATGTTAQFRAYASPAQSFEDYVAVLRDNPRYSAALNTGGDVQAFAAALQRGGYATDPDYANKITAISHRVSGALAAIPGVDTGTRAGAGAGVTDLKLADALPITGQSGPL